MRSDPVRRALGRIVAIGTVAVAACVPRAANGPVPTQVVLSPPAPNAAAGAERPAVLPDLAVEQLAAPSEDRIQEFSAYNEDIRLVVKEIAQAFNLDYRLAPEVEGRVNVRMQGATLTDLLRSVVRPHGFDYELQDGVLYVGPARVESKIFSLDYVALSRVGTSSTVIQRRLGSSGIAQGTTGGGVVAGGIQGGGGSDVISSTSIADLWGEIRIALDAIVFGADSAGGGQAGTVGSGQPGMFAAATTASSRVDNTGRMLVINPMAGTILVHASKRTLQDVGAFLSIFEASIQRQVLIEAKIVEVQLDRDFEFGIDWSAVQRVGNVDLKVGTVPGAGGLQFTLNGGANQITGVLRTLSEQGDVRVLSSPQVSALNNQRAIFNVTTDEVIFTVTRQPILGPNGNTIGFSNNIGTQQIAVGIVLDVFPQISPDNTVSMNIRPAITNVARIETIRTEDGSEARAPVIDRREVDTFARVRPGETIVIGGLMQTRRERRRTGVPILKDLPLLGYIFGRITERETRGELVIFITPTIVSGQLREGG